MMYNGIRPNLSSIILFQIRSRNRLLMTRAEHLGIAMSKNPEKIEFETESSRPWGDLCWDLLKPIYSKLQRSGCNDDDTRLVFGSVCRNWHQFHSANSINSQQPETTRIGDHTFRIGDILDQRKIDLVWGVTMPRKMKRNLYSRKIAYIWDSGWWLL
ncbi:hypothetical protein LINPERPRIM_LOCUS26763 [Linum perenne]